MHAGSALTPGGARQRSCGGRSVCLRKVLHEARTLGTCAADLSRECLPRVTQFVLQFVSSVASAVGLPVVCHAPTPRFPSRLWAVVVSAYSVHGGCSSWSLVHALTSTRTHYSYVFVVRIPTKEKRTEEAQARSRRCKTEE